MSDQLPAGPDVLREPPAVEPLDPVMLAEVLESLARRLESLEVLAETIADQMTQAPAGGPWSWRHLGPTQTRALLTELRDWVDWLIGRYDLIVLESRR